MYLIRKNMFRGRGEGRGGGGLCVWVGGGVVGEAVGNPIYRFLHISYIVIFSRFCYIISLVTLLQIQLI